MLSNSELKHIFETRYDRSKWISVLKENFGLKEAYAEPRSVKLKPGQDLASEYFVLGKLITKDDREIGVYEVPVSSGVKIERNKVGLRNLLKEVYKNEVDAAFVVFDQKKKWRFTYVSEITVRAKDGGREKKKTDPKRYTYLMGEGERCKTAADRFTKLRTTSDLFGEGVTLNAIEEAFSVDKLSKSFFDEYRKHYGRFTKYLTGKDENNKEVGKPHPLLKSVFNGQEKEARDFVKKMLGRIVFLYFLEKKGWLGVPEDKSWGYGDENFLSNLFRDCIEKGNFYQQVLVPLYFNTLNEERSNDLFKIRASLFSKPGYNKVKIPYLNGGLFDNDEKHTDNLVFPQELFAGLFDFFDQYNFTVYEDSPDEHTVAVDPEMLGHIFENLLEDNKDKGAYYTPKEIVHYMCRESLIEYLYTKLNPLLSPDGTAQEKLPRAAIEKLVLHHEAADIIQHDEAILTALKEVKICDPAIGSGAFPMGLLLEIFHLVETLFNASPDVTSATWKLGRGWNPAKVKEEIIQNSIYGVDIEKGAVDIARLRFWLSLIVDENTPRPLPNLDYKIVVGDSLLSKFEDEIIDIDWDIKYKNASAVQKIILDQQKKLHLLQARQHLYFHVKSDKTSLQHEIRDLKIDILINQLTLSKLSFVEANPKLGGFAATPKEIQKNLENEIRIVNYDNTIAKLKKLKESKDAPLHFFDWKLDFPEVLNEKVVNRVLGFDIVIANPPYGAEVDHAKMNTTYTLSQKRLSNTYSYFIEKSLSLTRKRGNITLIVPNTWLSIKSTKSLRTALLVDNTIKQLLFTHQVFESMADVPPIVDTVVFTCILQKNHTNELNLITLSDSSNINDRLLEIESRKWYSVITTQILAQNDNRIELKKNILQVNRKNLFYLEEKKDPKYIVRIGTQEYAVGKGKPPLTKEQVRQRIYHSEEKLDSTYMPFVPCGDIQPFLLNWSNTYLKWGENLHCPRDKEIYSKEHLIVSRIFDKKNKRLKVCYAAASADDFYVNNTDSFCVVATAQVPVIPMKTLLALLNSKLIGYQLMIHNVNLMRSIYPKINTDDLKNICLPRKINTNTETKIMELVEAILTQKKIKSNDTITLERNLDYIVYRLYDLKYSEACTIEENTTWMTEEDYKNFEVF